MNQPSEKPKTKGAKNAVFRPKYRMRVERDHTKYTRTVKHKENDHG